MGVSRELNSGEWTVQNDTCVRIYTLHTHASMHPQAHHSVRKGLLLTGVPPDEEVLHPGAQLLHALRPRARRRLFFFFPKGFFGERASVRSGRDTCRPLS